MEPDVVTPQLREILTRLDWSGRDDFTVDYVGKWARLAFDTLLAGGLIVPSSPTTTVACLKCEEGCVFTPERQTTFDQGVLLVGPCPYSGIVTFPLDALRTWRLDLGGIAATVAACLNLPREGVIELLAGRLWRLGTYRRGRTHRTLYFTHGLSLEPRVILDVAERVSGAHPIILVPVRLPPSSIWPDPPGPILALSDAIGFHEGQMTIDEASLDLEGDEAADDPDDKGIVPIRTPRNTTWSRVTIRLVDDQLVDVLVAGRTYRRTAAELGLLDRRYRPPIEGCLWANFKTLAKEHGELDWKTDGATPAARQYMRLTRKYLSQVFPDIEGNPIVDCDGRGWKTAFLLCDQRRE